MDYKLQISTHIFRKNSEYRFAVIKGPKDYPANFVCLLPMKLVQSKENHSFDSVFGRYFGKESLNVASELLKNALETEEDSGIKAEIKKRLKLICANQTNAVCLRNSDVLFSR